MHIPDPTEESIIKVYDALAEFGEGRGEERYRKFSEYLLLSSEVEKWLVVFLCRMNTTPMFRPMSRDPYLMFEPAKEQTSSFLDFLQVLKAIRSKSYDKALIQFMLGCTEKVQEFYWLCLEQPPVVTTMARMEVVRELVADTDIATEDLLGDFTFVTAGWMHITFPLVLTAVPDPTLVTAIIYRVAVSGWYKIIKYIPRPFRKPKATHLHYTWFKDRKFIHTPEFVILGKIDEVNNKFYPFDFFNTAADYQKWRRGKGGKPHKDRIEDLNHFLKTNFVRQVQRVPLIYAHTSHNMEVNISRLLREAAEHSKVMACDGKLRTYCLDTVEREGVIGGLWVEVGEVKGFIVWYSGCKVHVGYDFQGNDEALIFCPEVVIGKLCKFSYFEYSGYKVGGLREILWDKPMYKPNPIKFSDGEVGWLERCPHCLNQSKNYSYGCCENSINSLPMLLATNGPDTWFKVPKKILKRRQELGWHPDFLNKCGVRYRGYRFISNDQDQFMFQSDENYQIEYQHWWNTVGKNYMPEGDMSFEALQTLYQKFLSRQKERNANGQRGNQEETGGVRSVSELHQQDVVDGA